MSAASACPERGGSTGHGGGWGAGGAGSTMEIPWGLLEYWEYHGNTGRCWEAMGGRGRPWGCWGATGCHGVLVGQLGVQGSGGSRVGPGSASRLPAPTISGALTANEGQHGNVTGAHTWGMGSQGLGGSAGPGLGSRASPQRQAPSRAWGLGRRHPPHPGRR